MSYTKGPWLYRPNPYDDWGSVRNGEGYLVAVAANPSISESQYAAHRAARTDPYEANARLIAAAPDVREELKRWARWDEMTEAELALALETTTAALAKAGAV